MIYLPTTLWYKSGETADIKREHWNAMDKTVVKKRGALPAYTQLVNIIREDIASGRFAPGIRIPSEAALAKQYSVSPMTVRQAIGVLVEDGLVKRVHGSGTFVKRVEVGATTFDLKDLDEVLSDTETLDVSVLKSDIVRARGDEGKMLELEIDEPVILVERLIRKKQIPFCFQTAYLPFDPEAPVVENMLETTGLSSLFFSDERHGYKKGTLKLLPCLMDDRDSEFFGAKTNRLAFKLEYIYYDFNDNPSAYGWFTIPPEQMPMISHVGVWDE